jgi:hypothetical protein
MACEHAALAHLATDLIAELVAMEEPREPLRTDARDDRLGIAADPRRCPTKNYGQGPGVGLVVERSHDAAHAVAS